MVKLSQKHKFWAVAMLMVIVLVLSSILGSAISARERTTGGMETKWKLEIHTGEMGMGTFQSNDSIIINDVDAQQIKAVDSGGVTWSYSYSSLMSFSSYDGRIYIIDQLKDTRTFMILDSNGSVLWRFTNPNVLIGFKGVDGNYYVEFGRSSITDKVSCFGSDGLIKWIYQAENGSISISVVCPDGCVILYHHIEGWNTTLNADAITGKEYISLTPNGTVQGRLEESNLPAGMFSYAERANNGTILVCHRYEYQPKLDYWGVTEDLHQLWSKMNGTDFDIYGEDGYILGEGSIRYSLSSRNVTGDYGIVSVVSTLSAYNSSDGSYLFKTDFNGSAGKIQVNGNTVFYEDYYGHIWAVGSDGHSREAIDSAGWMKFGSYGNGFLVYKTTGLKLIGSDGSTTWQFDLDGTSINHLYVGTGGTIYVITSDAVTAIDKPKMPTTSMFMVGLVGIDLLFVLLGSMWLFENRPRLGKMVP